MSIDNEIAFLMHEMKVEDYLLVPIKNGFSISVNSTEYSDNLEEKIKMAIKNNNDNKSSNIILSFCELRKYLIGVEIGNNYSRSIAKDKWKTYITRMEVTYKCN